MMPPRPGLTRDLRQLAQAEGGERRGVAEPSYKQAREALYAQEGRDPGACSKASDGTSSCFLLPAEALRGSVPSCTHIVHDLVRVLPPLLRETEELDAET